MNKSSYVEKLIEQEGAKDERSRDSRLQSAFSKWTNRQDKFSWIEMICFSSMGMAAVSSLMLIIPGPASAYSENGQTTSLVMLISYIITGITVVLGRRQEEATRKAEKLSSLKEIFALLSEKPFETRFRYEEDGKIKVTIEANQVREGGCVIKTKSQHITAYICPEATTTAVAKFMKELVLKAETELPE